MNTITKEGQGPTISLANREGDKIRMTADGFDARHNTIRIHQAADGRYAPAEEDLEFLPAAILTPEQIACAD